MYVSCRADQPSTAPALLFQAFPQLCIDQETMRSRLVNSDTCIPRAKQAINGIADRGSSWSPLGSGRSAAMGPVTGTLDAGARGLLARSAIRITPPLLAPQAPLATLIRRTWSPLAPGRRLCRRLVSRAATSHRAVHQACWRTDDADVGQRDQDIDTGCGHQQPRHLVLPGHGRDPRRGGGCAPGYPAAEIQTTHRSLKKLARRNAPSAPERLIDSPKPFATASITGRGCCASSTTAASRSTPIPSSAACARLLSTEKMHCFAGSDVGASYCPSGDVLIKPANFAEDCEISGVLTAAPRHHGARSSSCRSTSRITQGAPAHSCCAGITPLVTIR